MALEIARLKTLGPEEFDEAINALCDKYGTEVVLDAWMEQI